MRIHFKNASFCWVRKSQAVWFAQLADLRLLLIHWEPQHWESAASILCLPRGHTRGIEVAIRSPAHQAHINTTHTQFLARGSWCHTIQNTLSNNPSVFCQRSFFLYYIVDLQLRVGPEHKWGTEKKMNTFTPHPLLTGFPLMMLFSNSLQQNRLWSTDLKLINTEMQMKDKEFKCYFSQRHFLFLL